MASPAVASVQCNLCGLPSGATVYKGAFDGAEKQFCCHGCLHVFTILRESGALGPGVDPRDTDLFRKSLEAGLIARPESAADAAETDGEVKELALQVDGMWCASCGWLIEHMLLRERGVVSAEVLFTSDLVKVRYLPQRLPPGRIPERIERLGYGARAYAPGVERSDDGRRRDLQLRLGVAGFVWMNVMTLSSVFYVSYFEAIADSMRAYLPWVLMVLTAPAVFYSAWPVLRLAGLGVREGVLRMEALLSLGILAAYGFSIWQAFAGGVHFYFDTACAIITFVLIGKLLEAGAKETAARAVTLLHRMMPRKARIMDGSGRERWVAVERLECGAAFVVKPGERVPADGRVSIGRSLLDESVITGESRPVERRAGDAIVGGSLNISGVLTVTAAATGEEGTLRRMILAVEAALSSRARVERRVDRVTAVFIPVVLALAVATYLGWLYIGGVGVSASLMHAIAVLVVACPCALGIATPLAISSAVSAASRHGILINNADVWETVDGIGTVVFDKTGTVTSGQFRMLRCAGMAEEALLQWVGPVEVMSEHPLARAIVERAVELKMSFQPAPDVLRYDGMGVSGSVFGKEVFAGNARLALLFAGRIPGALSGAAEGWQNEGLSAVYVGWGGEVRAVICCGDEIRADARAAFGKLRRSGLQTLVLSGDAKATTAAVSRQVGATSFEAEVLPEGKAEFIRRLQASRGGVAMVGDGVNDAPALAQATLGIAMGSGSALAMQAAPVVLMTPSLRRVGDTFDLAARTVATVRRNLFWAFAYNAAGISLAVMGVLTPLWAAGAMIVSSVSVIVQSARLARWEPEE
ncbi:MAG: heavy metal translocating P-type ATPase [Bryobacterales bacterium]|nr:heavy metal translocating P-type ATPase [Bryobacterales bacterium]